MTKKVNVTYEWPQLVSFSVYNKDRVKCVAALTRQNTADTGKLPASRRLLTGAKEHDFTATIFSCYSYVTSLMITVISKVLTTKFFLFPLLPTHFRCRGFL